MSEQISGSGTAGPAEDDAIKRQDRDELAGARRGAAGTRRGLR